MTSSGLYLYPRNVEGQKEMSLALEKLVIPGTAHPATPRSEDTDQRLNISVIFTSVESTLAALRKAGSLAASLGARITILAPQTVPYPLPLESPPVLLDWNERRFRVIASESPVETIVRLYLCRDEVEALKSALSPRSVVVIGGPKRRWPFTREKRLAAALRRAGHEVIFSERE
jgi:hypothetical protein